METDKRERDRRIAIQKKASLSFWETYSIIVYQGALEKKEEAAAIFFQKPLKISYFIDSWNNDP